MTRITLVTPKLDVHVFSFVLDVRLAMSIKFRMIPEYQSKSDILFSSGSALFDWIDRCHVMLVSVTLTLSEAHGICRNCLFVGCLRSQQHASVSQGRICTILCAATLRQKLQIKLSTSPSHSILTQGRPVPPH